MNSPLKQNTTTIQELLNTINSLPEAGGVDLPELANEGSASDLLSDKQLIGSDGNLITGTIQDFDGSYECSGESTGGGSYGSASVTTGNFAYTKEMGGEPGTYNYVLTSTDL